QMSLERARQQVHRLLEVFNRLLVEVLPNPHDTAVDEEDILGRPIRAALVELRCGGKIGLRRPEVELLPGDKAADQVAPNEVGALLDADRQVSPGPVPLSLLQGNREEEPRPEQVLVVLQSLLEVAEGLLRIPRVLLQSVQPDQEGVEGASWLAP